MVTMSIAEREPTSTAAESADQPVVIGGRRYLRAPVPVHFPEEECMPESKRHLERRTLLYQVLHLAFADRAAIGCDQFVYWDPTDPKQCVAPDVFLRWGAPDDPFPSWKVWERGAPHVAIEVVSRTGNRDSDWERQLGRYRRLGVTELIRFNANDPERPLRIWEAVEGDLIEREVVRASAPSQVLPGYWVLADSEPFGPMLRLSHDPEGRDLYPTPAEHEARARQREAEARRREAEARVAAEQRIRELEEELRRRG